MDFKPWKMFLAWGKGMWLDDFSEIPSSPSFSLILCLSFYESNAQYSEDIPKRGAYSVDLLAFSCAMQLDFRPRWEKQRENASFLLFVAPSLKKWGWKAVSQEQVEAVLPRSTQLCYKETGEWLSWKYLRRHKWLKRHLLFSLSVLVVFLFLIFLWRCKQHEL